MGRLITFKDILDLKPYCNIYVNNSISLVKLYDNPDYYIVTDMKVCDGGLELLVCPKDGFSFKYNKLGYVSAGIYEEKEVEEWTLILWNKSYIKK